MAGRRAGAAAVLPRRRRRTPPASTVASTSGRRSATRCAPPQPASSRSSEPCPGAAGRLTIQTADGYAVTLLQLGSADAARGATVAEGDLVGRVGESSDSATTAPHVHLGVRVATDPEGYVDPVGLLPARPVAPAPEPARAPAPAPVPAVAACGRTLAAGGARRAAAGAPRRSCPDGRADGRRRAFRRGRAAPCCRAAGRRRASACHGARSGARRLAAGRRPNACGRIGSRPARTVALRPRRARSRRSVAAEARTGGSRRAAASDPRRARAPPPRRLPLAAPALRSSRRRPSAGARHTRRAHVGSGRPRRVARPDPAPARRFRRRGGRDRGQSGTKGLRLSLAAMSFYLDDTDLLRQLDASHRPRVHDDHGRHPRAPSQAARGGDVLPHGSRRARGQGRPCRGGGGAHTAGVRRPDRARLARARPERQRRAELLHPDDR